MKYSAIQISLILLLVAGLARPAFAAAPSSSGAPTGTIDVDQALDKLKNMDSSTEKLSSEELPKPEAMIQNLSYSATEELKAELGRAIYADYIASLEHDRRVFNWQLTSSRITFWIVLMLVGAGIVFSALQFYKSFRLSAKADGQDQNQLTELEISTGGVKVSSPVLGVIILVISLAFFYLFLVHVYPVKYVEGSATPTIQE